MKQLYRALILLFKSDLHETKRKKNLPKLININQYKRIACKREGILNKKKKCQSCHKC